MVPDEVIEFTEETMKTWRVELTAGRKMLSRGKDPERHIPGRCTITITICNSNDTRHIFSENELPDINSVNQPFNVHQTVCQKWKRIGNYNAHSENIQLRYRDKIYQRKMRHASIKKQETTLDRRNRTNKSRKNQNAKRRGNLQILLNIGSWHHQTSGDKKKTHKKRVSQEKQKTIL